jgi:hypothetical protein
MPTPRVALCACLAFAACSPRPPAPQPLVALASPATVREFQVREAQLENGGIVVRLEIPPAPAGPKPAILANLNESATMLSEGAVIVTYKIDWSRLKGAPPPAAPTQGETAVGKWVLAAPTEGSIGQQYIRQIIATATIVVPRVLDYLETVPEVDMSRVAITGGSTNGFIALQAVAADKRLGVASVIAACGDYHTFLRLSSMGTGGKPLALEPAYERWLRAQEVVEHPRRVVHAALLMVNRVQDALIPIACADATDRVLARAFRAAGRSDRYRFVRIEDAEGHGLGAREDAENLAWLRRWLFNRR